MMEMAVSIQPDNPIGYSNLCSLLCRAERYQEALKYSKCGIALPNATADMWFNHGIICKNISSLDQAAHAFRKARDMSPDCAMTHCQLANVLLATNNFEEGLREDEWRFKAHSGLAACRRRYEQPDWDGKSDLCGKRIVVFNEQGMGDAIQFSRYLKVLKEKGCYIIFEVHPSLIKLYEDFPWADEVVESYDHSEKPQLPKHDLIVSVGSLPHFLDPNLENIPMEVPYMWPKQTPFLKLDDSKLRVGIIWAGSQWHTNDKERSCYLKYFKPLSKLNIHLFSLQQGDMIRTWAQGKSVLWQGNEHIDVVDLAAGVDFDYTDLSPHLRDFNDTALAMQQLDLVLTVDTAVAHLAGALGVNTWLLLPWAHEWRWLKKWYPTMKMMRQPSPGDWEGLIAQVVADFSEFFA